MATSILPVAFAQTADTRTIRETFTVEGNSLDEIEEQVRQQVNALGLTNEEEEAVDEILDELDEEVPSEEAIDIECRLIITLTINCRDTFDCDIDFDIDFECTGTF